MTEKVSIREETITLIRNPLLRNGFQGSPESGVSGSSTLQYSRDSHPVLGPSVEGKRKRQPEPNGYLTQGV